MFITIMRLAKTKVRSAVVAFIVAAVVTGLVRHCLGTFAIVDGDSMFPTFNRNDLVRAKALYAEPARGDVVIVTDDNGDRVMKRVIGLPGETVSLFHGFVYIDRQRLSEPYLPRRTYTFRGDEVFGLPTHWRLAADEYFLLGDNRFRSHDSRNFGPVKRRDVHSLVLTEKVLPPGFCDIVLVGSGNTTSAKFSPRGERINNNHLASNTGT